MAPQPLPDEVLQASVDAYRGHDTITAAAISLGISRDTLTNRLRRAAERGMMGTDPVLPGFRITQITNTPKGDFVQQKPDLGPDYEPLDGMALKGRTTWVKDGRISQAVYIERADAEAQRLALQAVIDGLKEELPRIAPTKGPAHVLDDLVNQYTVTDNHLGMLSWREETGADYDLRIAEELLLDWFSAAIAASPDAHTGILAQLGDLMHHDALESVTPASKHVLDADSRLQKIIRVVIRVLRQIVSMLLQKHKRVHIIMASGNHDPASSAWLRELLAVLYETEPRVSVDTSPALYYAFEWGKTGLFFHHGHRRGVNNADATFARMFREMYGRCTHNYAHIGHLHSNAKSPASSLMEVERHETLAAPDAYAAGGGWLAGRSAKVITYSKHGGEVFRSTLSSDMISRRSA